MARTIWRGVTLDARTALMLAEADRLVGPTVPVRPTQGCYNGGGVAASAGTHDGGGAVDISARDLTLGQIVKVVRALRRVGFAAWYRSPDEGPWGPHIHAIAVGCPDLAPVARRQVDALRAGRNGLASGGRDRHAWMKLPVVTWEQYLAAKDAPKPKPVRAPGSRTLRVGMAGDDVVALQRFLGVRPVRTKAFGPKTYLAVRAWQQARKLHVDGVVGPQTWAALLPLMKKEPARG